MDVDFYANYRTFKDYAPPALRPKTVRRFDAQIWRPAGFAPSMRVLELGCGTGGFLLYLKARGVTDFLGVDADSNLADVIPPDIRDRVELDDAFTVLRAGRGTFDRVVLLDVLEHFTPSGAAGLIGLVREVLRPGGKVVIRVPNGESPWGRRLQHGDLTHLTAFTKASLTQLADACGLKLERAYGQREGPLLRRASDAMIHGLLSRAILSPPDVWEANLYVILAPA